MGPRCSSAETQVCHRNYIIAATWGQAQLRIFDRKFFILASFTDNMKTETYM